MNQVKLSIKGRILYGLAALAAMLSILLCMKGEAKAAGTGTIYVSIERFTIGQGYLVEPVTMTFSQGESYAHVIERLAQKYNLKLTADRKPSTGTTINYYYLRSIANADKGKLDIPDIIMNMPAMDWKDENVSPPTNTVNDGNDFYPDLGEFAYGRFSGWYYLVNGNNPGTSFSSLSPTDGDVCRYMFTLYGIGKDVENPELPAREAMTKTLALMNSNQSVMKARGWKNAYDKAIQVISDLDSTQAQMDAAYKALPTVSLIQEAIREEAAIREAARKKAIIKKYTPAKVTLRSVKAGKKKAKIKWKKIASATGYQIYYSRKPSSGFKKLKTLRKAKIVTLMKKGLKSKKKYYFKVRAYRKAGGKTYYGPFSKVKGVKIK